MAAGGGGAYNSPMRFTIETEKEADGRWIAEAVEVRGAMVYGRTRADAVAKVKALALRVVAKRLIRMERTGIRPEDL